MRPEGDFLPLGEVRQKGGKLVVAWAVEGDADPSALASTSVRIEWPPRSERFVSFPEVDRAEWLTVDEARAKILASQSAFLDRLVELVGDRA